MTVPVRAITWIVLLASAGSPAKAELPAPVRAMLDAAIASGSEADIASVAKVAKVANPADAKEIDAMVASHRQAVKRAELAHKREASTFEDWHGNGELGGSTTTGNTRSAGLSAGLTLTKTGIKWRHRVRATTDYQRNDGATTRNQWMASYEPNFQLRDSFYLFGLAMYEKDRFQGFSDRTTVSGGFGYRAVETDDLKIDIKGGPAWRGTHWLDDPATNELEGLAGTDLVWRLTSRIEISDNAQAIWGADNSTYSNTAAFTAKLNGSLSGRFSYAVRHETNPPPGSVATDTITRATLVYGF
ncbi:DUF481 domain-containing protein [Sphingobium sp. SYK-6]|uniref:DUF481 domain-containing protein n=1 Tax=Sphingobium sp. (strain NBRC 103272 / SYK-6) TaxID=627192 RepID=UPI0002E540BD|nr:DUF481 domain-containing protein [Sphingobium sp. SYK-6]